MFSDALLTSICELLGNSEYAFFLVQMLLDFGSFSTACCLLSQEAEAALLLSQDAEAEAELIVSPMFSDALLTSRCLDVTMSSLHQRVVHSPLPGTCEHLITASYVASNSDLRDDSVIVKILSTKICLSR